MKHEWRRHEKKYYLPQERVEILTVPEFKYIILRGVGSPDSAEFQARLEALYAVSYAIRMLPKSGVEPEGWYEYTVYPLEGLWTLDGEWDESNPPDKSKFRYELMIRQPEFVTDGIVGLALDKAAKKADPAVLRELEKKSIRDGSSVQILHVGPYDDEPRSFARIRSFMRSNGLMRTSLSHREIYLNNPRKTEPDALHTVLRLGVRSVTESDR